MKPVLMRLGFWLLLTAVLLAMWVPCLWYDLGDGTYVLRQLSGTLIPIGIAFLVFLAIWSKRIAPLILVLMTPLTMYLILGAAQWPRDRPRFHGMGLPGEEFFNLDPQTRCYEGTGGCVIAGGEWVRNAPHNVGLRIMLTLFGKPPLAYTGPYPSKQEVLNLMSNAVPTAPEEFLSGKVLAGGKTNTIAKATVRGILCDLQQSEFEYGEGWLERSVQGAIHQGRCLIIRVKSTDRLLQDDPQLHDFTNHDGCILFDLQTMRAFARYTFHGDVSRIPSLLND